LSARVLHLCGYSCFPRQGFADPWRPLFPPTTPLIPSPPFQRVVKTSLLPLQCGEGKNGQGGETFRGLARGKKRRGRCAEWLVFADGSGVHVGAGRVAQPFCLLHLGKGEGSGGECRGGVGGRGKTRGQWRRSLVATRLYSGCPPPPYSPFAVNERLVLRKNKPFCRKRGSNKFSNRKNYKKSLDKYFNIRYTDIN
jgi:hypothetical protein